MVEVDNMLKSELSRSETRPRFNDVIAADRLGRDGRDLSIELPWSSTDGSHQVPRYMMISYKDMQRR